MRGCILKYALRRPVGFIPFDLEFRSDVDLDRHLQEGRMSQSIDSDLEASPSR